MEIENYNKFIQQLIQSSKILKDHISKYNNILCKKKIFNFNPFF